MTYKQYTNLGRPILKMLKKYELRNPTEIAKQLAMKHREQVDALTCTALGKIKHRMKI